MEEVIVLALLVCLVRADVDFTKCRLAVGMESGQIPDSAITSSSSYDVGTVGPHNARIRTESNGGAWCPRPQISPDRPPEWLQIDLGKLMIITLVETQGRFGKGKGQEFTEQYMIDYQRENTWIRFRNRRGVERFHGNSNTYIASLREINPPIIARRVRIIPYSTHLRTVCLRVELYGCPWEDDLVEYNMKQGDRRGEVVLYDYTYDGEINEGYLSGGLGQLVDGEVGQTNFRLDPQGLGMKGYEWIGWKNETAATKPVEIIFKFDTVRNFSSIQFHCNNLYSKDVRVFKRAKFSFSIGGRYYQRNSVIYEHMRDSLIDYARPVMIKQIRGHIGRYMKVQLWFDGRWTLISEVSFESVPAKGNFTLETPSVSLTTGKPGSKPDSTSSNSVGKSGDKKSTYYPKDATFDTKGKTDKIKPKPTDSGSNIKGEKHDGLDGDFIPIIIGALAAVIFIMIVIAVIVIIRHRRRKRNNKATMVDNQVTINLNDLQQLTNGASHHSTLNEQVNGDAKLMNGNMYKRVAIEENEQNERQEIYYDPQDVIQSRKLPEVPNKNNRESFSDFNTTMSSREYAVPDITKSSANDELPPSYDDYYASTEIVPAVPNIQGVSGNNVYAVSNVDLVCRDDISVMEFPRENLQFVEKLGEGQFGEVHLCAAVNMTEFLGDDFLINRTESQTLLVAVKVLRKDAGELAKNDFIKEIKIMSRLKDPNIVQVLGMCSKDEPLCMVVEFMKYGDLNQFLADHVAENTLTRKTSVKTLSYGCLIYIASQVASGMKYLESLNMVHRDLATRNCLVGHLYQIKISDFGMSRSLYSSDYYRIEGRAILPIRWMAWESILLGKFTTKSDVWSFGVCLWEVLTYAKAQPYEHLTDEQVIENCGHFYRNDGEQVYLPQPNNCPKEIYDLIVECWNRQESERPAFKEIHMFMQRKNMGYNPREELVLRNRLPVC